jgi:hypothetical protein
MRTPINNLLVIREWVMGFFGNIKKKTFTIKLLLNKGFVLLLKNELLESRKAIVRIGLFYSFKITTAIRWV